MTDQSKKRRKPRDLAIPEADRKNVPWRELPRLEVRDPSKRGQPRKMNEITLARIKTVCETCAAPSDAYICSIIGVQIESWKKWMREYIGFRELVDGWKAQGLEPLRRKAVQDAQMEGGRMLQWLLERRDNDFRRRPVGDNAGADDEVGRADEIDLPPTEFL